MKTKIFIILIFLITVLSSCKLHTELTLIPTITPVLVTTPTRIPTIAPVLVSTPSRIPTYTPTPIFPIGELIHFSRDNNIEYDWFLYIPKNVDRTTNTHILISGVHGNVHSQDYGEIISESRELALGRIDWARGTKSILVVPVIPKYYDYQPYDFDLPCFNEKTDNFYQRPDKKINEIIDYLTGELRADEYLIDAKIIIEGFSSGGMFAQRYALLNPNRVDIIVAGHCGGTFILPESEYEFTPINWPVGINNFELLTEEKFDKEAYQKIKQFIFIGKNDDNTTLILNSSRSLWESQSQIDFVHNHFGESSYEIIRNQIEYLRGIGYENISFKGYDGYGHEYAGVMVNDAVSFILENK